MLVLRAVMQVVRAAILRSAQLLQPMEAAVVVQALVLLLILLVDAVVASALKVRTHTTQVLMAVAPAATAPLLLESVP